MPTNNQGIATLSVPSMPSPLLAKPIDENKEIKIPLATFDGTLPMGTVVSMSSVDATNGTQLFAACADATAVQTAALAGKALAVIKEAVSASNTTNVVNGWREGSFFQAALTPDDIPLGVWGDFEIVKGEQ